MDPRVREHARIVVDHSTDVSAGDLVVVKLPPGAEDLGVALHEAIGERGATPVYLNGSLRARRAYLRAAEEYAEPVHETALYEAADVVIRARAFDNATEKADVPSDDLAAHQSAYSPTKEELLSKTWCLTQHPTSGSAQLAGMSTAEYENFVYDAVTLDWARQREFQAQMVEILDPAEEVRVVSGDDTDVRMRVAGNHTLNDDGEANLPGGEVFTAPVKHSVEGEVRFDMPLHRDGREIEDVRLTFEDGRVVDHDADRNEALLTEILNTDEGARYLGELGIGMNRAIDRFSANMLFDEKMGDTVHMAVGKAYPDTVGDDNECNQSAQHVDMIVDMSEDSRIEVDGEVVQRDGTFRFEDGF
ncbi:MAG: aminopeptidase [Halolamina sp.]